MAADLKPPRPNTIFVQCLILALSSKESILDLRKDSIFLKLDEIFILNNKGKI